MSLGRLTGIAVAAATQRIWVTDGASLQSVVLSAPWVTASPPTALWLGAPQMTGLDWDPVAGHLVGCDASGNLYRFTTSGVAVGPQPWIAAEPWWSVPGGLGPATDVAVPHIPLGPGSADAVIQFVGSGVLVHDNTGQSWTGSGYIPYPPSAPFPPPNSEAGLALHYGVERVNDGISCGCLYGSFTSWLPGSSGRRPPDLHWTDWQPARRSCC